MTTPPTYSATANCQPRRMRSTTPSSMTRLVDANMNTMAEMKSAPFSYNDLAMAVAAYEHEEDTIPKKVARPTAAGRWSPITRCISSLETKACTAPESPKPNTSAQRVSQNMTKPSRSL